MTQETSISFLITSGNGPAECDQAVSGVLQRLHEEAEDYGLDLDVSATQAKHGPRSAVAVVYGAGGEAFADRWCGTIRWRAKSRLRPHHKRSNWFVGVFKLKPSVSPDMVVQPGDVAFESFRAGGPGGQHQNTTDSAIRATHRPTGLTAMVRQTRSQHRNKALALERLQAMMNAKAVADQAAGKDAVNQLHNTLDRGNLVRCFKGDAFREEGVC